MEDPSIIPSDRKRLRADAEPFVPKNVGEIPKKAVEIPKKVGGMPIYETTTKPHISMRQRIAFRDFALLLESLYMCKKDTGQIDRAFILLNIFESLLIKGATVWIIDILKRIQHESKVIQTCQMKGSTELMLHIGQFSMLIEELYAFMVRLNVTVF
jgi:hypothetical protein